ncbi:antitoxin [Sinosporangium siamense]|nr:antitoxin [Sinosporangium siamense]
MNKLRGLLGSHSDKVEKAAKQGIDKAADMAKQRTGGKYDQQIDTAAAKAREAADKIDNRPGTPGGHPGAPGEQPPGEQGRPPAP